jgi:hypothetical protein
MSALLFCHILQSAFPTACSPLPSLSAPPLLRSNQRCPRGHLAATTTAKPARLPPLHAVYFRHHNSHTQHAANVTPREMVRRASISEIARLKLLCGYTVLTGCETKPSACSAAPRGSGLCRSGTLVPCSDGVELWACAHLLLQHFNDSLLVFVPCTTVFRGAAAAVSVDARFHITRPGPQPLRRCTEAVRICWESTLLKRA